jgi:beta-RFAP synthase
MIRVRTASRLHFGPLNLVPATLASSGASPARWFGGVGMMVARPGVHLVARPAPHWAAAGPLADRALAFARRLSASFHEASIPPHDLQIEASAPEHSGLGTGTQLGLAVARAVTHGSGLDSRTVPELARLVGRGQRSGLGVHGFAVGGFLVEGGKRDPTALAPLIARMEFPSDWRLVLILGCGEPGVHGATEETAFERLGADAVEEHWAGQLCRLVLLGMLPALAEKDEIAFGEALYEFNRRVGEAFAPVQGGIYASPRIAHLVGELRKHGIRGVGQSSWGPTAFAVVADEDRARRLADFLCREHGLEAPSVVVTGPANQGAAVQPEPW